MLIFFSFLTPNFINSVSLGTVSEVFCAEVLGVLFLTLSETLLRFKSLLLSITLFEVVLSKSVADCLA